MALEILTLLLCLASWYICVESQCEIGSVLFLTPLEGLQQYIAYTFFASPYQ